MLNFRVLEIKISLQLFGNLEHTSSQIVLRNGERLKRKGRELAKRPRDYWNPISIDQTKYMCRPNTRNLSKEYIEEIYEPTCRNMSTCVQKFKYI